jgi:carboxypeptidase family protein
MGCSRFAAFAAAGLIYSLVSTTRASAQRAAAPPPAGPRTIVGVVTDAASRPIEDVEIRIGSLDRTVRTGPNGIFRFDSVRAGKHELRARRLGYEAQARTVTVAEQGGSVAFVLKAIPQKLEPVITAVSRGGLGGIVTDGKSRPLKGATVRVFGGAARTVTDSAGEFFMDVRPGSFMVRVTSPGHTSRLLSVTIPKDSGRQVAIALEPGKPNSAREEIEMQNLARRLAWKVSPAAFFGREQLEQLGNKRLVAIVRGVNPNPLDESECMAVVNGGPDRVPLWYYDADELDGVEVYPTGTLSYATGDKRQQAIVFGRGARGGAVRNCPAVYVWLR